MSLLRAHRLGVVLTTAMGCVCILSCTGGSLVDGLLTLFAMASAVFGKQTTRRDWVETRSIAFVWFVFQVVVVVVLGLHEQSLALQGIRVVWALWSTRLATTRFASHDGQALLLSVMLVCAATVLAPSPWLAVSLLLYVTSLTSTLVTRQLLYDVTLRGFLQNEQTVTRQTLARRDVLTLPYVVTIAMLTSLLLVAGAVVFACFPRSQNPSHSGVQQSEGAFPDSVSLTAAPRAKSASYVLARVNGLSQQQFEHGLYLRADTYDVWRDGAFHVGESPSPTAQEKPDEAALPLSARYQVQFLSDVFARVPTLGPLDHAAVTWTGLYSPLVVRGPVRMDSLTAGGPPRSVNVAVVGALWPDATSASRRLAGSAETASVRAYQGLPNDIDPRIAPLARSIVGRAATFGGRARLLRHYLATHQTYSFVPSGAAGADPLADFLFVGKRGHCEYFSTAYALMLRATGVPARVVGGLAFGAWDADTRTVIFRGSHAHAWVEWWDPSRGWLLDDATPPAAGEWLGPFDAFAEHWRRAWDERVLSYGAQEQWALLLAASRLWTRCASPLRSMRELWMWPATSAKAGLLAALVALVCGNIWLRVPRGLRFEQRLARVLEERLTQALGRPLRRQETLGQAAQSLGASGHSALLVVHAYEHLRFGACASRPTAAERRSLLLRAQRLFSGEDAAPRGTSTGR